MNMNLRILDLIGQRLAKGEKRYGKENIASDGRDFVQESLEEALDCAVYLAGHIIELQEPTDHTSGDDGGKIKYKIIFGDKTQKE